MPSAKRTKAGHSSDESSSDEEEQQQDRDPGKAT